jgi:hypothetical protein
MVDTTLTYYSDTLIGSIGDCPVGQGGIVEASSVRAAPAGGLVTPGVIFAAIALLISSLVRATRSPD